VRRLSTPIEAWPQEDRAAWLRATGPADSMFGEASRAEEWAPATVRFRRAAFEQFVCFLYRQGHTDIPTVVPLVAQATIDAFVADMRGRPNNENTIGNRLKALHAALGLIAPGADFSFIVRPGGRPLRRVLRMRPRPVEVADTREIIAQVKALHRTGLAGQGYAEGRTARRDAALIGLIACRPERARAISVMRLGHHLFQRGEGWFLDFDADDTKQKHDRHLTVPDWLVPILEDYIHKVRPTLRGASATDALWLATRGGAVGYGGLGKIIRRRTTEWFGRGRGPHWLRKCYTTTVIEEDPKLALDAALVCDHSPQTQLEHYNMAKAVAAGRRHNDRVDRLMQETRALAAKAYGWKIKA
jgi:hypothetical protein